MNTASNFMRESVAEPQPAADVRISAWQSLYWSVRRELWENRSIYLAPLTVAALVLVGYLINLVHHGGMVARMTLTPAMQGAAMVHPFSIAAALIMGSTFLVAIFYSLEALHADRRDRSILFWKSLPVSDLTTVLAKAIVPLLILPLLTFAITVITQWIMLLIASVALLGSGLPLGTLWSQLALSQTWMMLLFHLLAIHGLWYAPVFGWLLLVSGWARRAPFLWAVFPPLILMFMENITTHSSYVAQILRNRMMGGPEGSLSMGNGMGSEAVRHLAVGSFLASPGLWTGLAFAAACLAGAVQLRRYQGPI